MAPLPAEVQTVARFLTWQAQPTRPDDPVSPGRQGLAAATISRRLAAINDAHKTQGHPPPGDSAALRKLLAGIRNAKGVGGGDKRPLLTDDVRRMAALCDRTTVKGLRDRALILLGFGGAFRRSELAALTYRSLHAPPGGKGLVVTLGRSKGDQAGEGRTVSVLRQGPELCPVQAVSEWMAAAGIGERKGPEGEADPGGELDEGPLFRSVQRNGRVPRVIQWRPKAGAALESRPNYLSTNAIGRIITGYAEAIGINPADIGAHSLRAGFVTSALLAGASIYRVRDVTGHRDLDTLMGYYRYAGNWDDHPGRDLG